jgi:hypothetical protein
VFFNQDLQLALFSAGSDLSLQVIDMTTGKLTLKKPAAHGYVILFISMDIFINENNCFLMI